MRRWGWFLLTLPFTLARLALLALYFLVWWLLRVIGSYPVLALGMIGVVVAGMQRSGTTSGEMLAMAAACALVNRGSYYLTRLLPRPGGTLRIRMPDAPERAVLAAPSTVRIALPGAPASASPGEAVMRSRLDPALLAIMQP